jgi:hypothetical protein
VRGAVLRRHQLLLFGFLTGACADARPDPEWTVVDSAGVRITLSAEADVPETTPSELLLSLGTSDGGGPTEFYRVRDVEIVDASLIAVANGGSEEVRVFSVDGAFVRAMGRDGHGPREFRGLGVIQDVGDSLFTYDSGNDRIAVRRLDGTFVRSYKLDWFRGALFPEDLSVPARTIAVTARYMTELVGTGLLVDTSLVSIYDETGLLIDSVATLPHNARFVKQVGDMRTTVGAPYLEAAHLVGWNDGFCYVHGPVAEVRCYDEGGDVREIMRVESAPRSVEPTHEEAFWTGVEAYDNEARRRAVLRLRDDITFPEHFPAFSDLATDDRGRIWAQRFRTPDDDVETWWVFDQGRLVRRVTAPVGFELKDVEAGMLAGVWRDELGLEYVRLYRHDAS